MTSTLPGNLNGFKDLLNEFGELPDHG